MSEDKKKEMEEKIKTSSGYPLFKFIGQIKKDIGNFDKSERNYFLKIAMDRVHELWLERFGDWEDAKLKMERLPTPQFYKTEDLLPINGYTCQFSYSKNGSSLGLFNPFTNSVYLIPSGELTTDQVKTIFGS